MKAPKRPLLPAEDDLQTTVAFFRQWLKDPKSIAAVAPSGRALARRMAAAVGLGARSVVEIGAGTGAVTRALVDCVNGERLVVVERNPELHDLLAARFPEVEIVEGDALELVEVVSRSHRAEVGSVDAVVSGLGLLTMTREDQRRLLDQAFQVLRPTGRFVQFTYAPVLPVHRELLAELGLCSRRTAFSLLNIPPASIYVVTRRRRSRRPPAAEARRTTRGRRGA